MVSEISCLQNDREKLGGDGDLAILKETVEEMSEANNFQDREVIAKLSAIEAKLDKDSDSEFRSYVKRELNSIKALVTQPSKVCTRAVSNRL